MCVRERERGECVTDDIVENEGVNVKSKMREKERERGQIEKEREE